MEQDYIVDDGLVERLLAALADALRRTRDDPFSAPVTVAEIYQDLVPYRAVRTALGFQMNADYEHTVLRLLAGENELARLDPEEAREELRAELDMPNPNVGLFRKFAACDVWILRPELTLGGDHAPADARNTAEAQSAPAAASAGAAEPEPRPTSFAAEPARRRPVQETEVETDLPMLELETEAVSAEGASDDAAEADDFVWAEPEPEGEWDAAEGELLLEVEVKEPAAEPDTSEQPAAAGSREPRPQPEAAPMLDSSQSQGTVATAKSAGSCAFCKGALPGGRVVRFCPFCGADQSMKPCSSCREPLEPSWKFCIGCGSQQG